MPYESVKDGIKMPFEYGFKEKVKVIKFKGGKPKMARVKKER